MSRLSGRTGAGRLRSIPPRLVMFGSFAGMSLVNYAFGLAAGWLLAPGDFGLLAFTQTLLTIGGLVLNSGFAWSLTAELVDADQERRGRAVRGAAVANGVLALAMSLIVLILFAAGPLRAGLENWPVAVIVIAAFPLLSLVAIARAAAQGNEDFAMLAALFVAEVAVKAGAGLGLVALGLGPAGAVAGFLIGAGCAAVLGAIYLVGRLGGRPAGPMTHPQFDKAGAMFAALLGMALLLNLDTIGLKLFNPADRAAVGRYQAGIVLANTPYYLLTATIPILFTQIARVKQVGRSAMLVAETLQLALVVLLPVEALLAAFPRVFLSLLFPAAYLAGAPTLRILAVANAAIILVAILSTAFQAAGEARVPGRVLLGITLSEVIVLSLVVPVFGGTGAASTFLGATFVALAVLAFLYVRRAGTQTARRAFGWLGRYGLAGVLGAATCLAIIRFTGSPILAMALGSASYAAVALALHLVSLPSLLGHSPPRVPLGAED